MLRNWLAGMLAGLGAADPQAAATALAACCEGFILHRTCRDDTVDPRPALTLLVRSVLG